MLDKITDKIKGDYYIHKPLFWGVIIIGIIFLGLAFYFEGMSALKYEKINVRVPSKIINNTIYICDFGDQEINVFTPIIKNNIKCDINDPNILQPGQDYFYDRLSNIIREQPTKTKFIKLFNYVVVLFLMAAFMINHFKYNYKKNDI